MKILGSVVCLIFGIGIAQAQLPTASVPNSSSDRGLFSNVSFGVAHDSSLGFTSEADYALGYDFNRKFTIESGIPVYLVATTQSTTQSGATNQTQTNALGDFFLRLTWDPKPTNFGYHMLIAGTAPTGDTNLGLSTGRAGILWGNHFEKDLGLVTPFGEFLLGNTQSPTQYFQRSYTVLGGWAGVRGGAHVDLGRRLGAEASFYDVAPFGTQKVYSRVVVHGANAGTAHTSKGRPYASQAVTTGGASIAADHGLGVGVSFDPSRRTDISFDYNHSIVQSLDTVGVTISYRIGHLPGNKRPSR